jgi:hypothetical protein
VNSENARMQVVRDEKAICRTNQVDEHTGDFASNQSIPYNKGASRRLNVVGVAAQQFSRRLSFIIRKRERVVDLPHIVVLHAWDIATRERGKPLVAGVQVLLRAHQQERASIPER